MSENNEDFAAMFEASLKPKRFERGQTIEGTIVAIRPEVAFINVGGKGEATIEISELKDEDGDLEVSVGDRIQAVVTATVPELTLSRKLARGAATNRQLEDAYRSGLAVEGKVEKAIKGGYEVRIGRQRAFCPFSQIDTARTDTAAHEGRVYPFRIIEYKEGGRNIVVSRRAILEDEQRARAAEVRESIVPGAVLTGRVASVRDFGAFVDLGGGIQGLLHVSEIGWSRVSDPAAILKAGEAITVKVLRVEADQQKISLGLKQLTDDPWSTIDARYAIGQVVEGRRHARRRFRCLCRDRAGNRSAGPRLDISTDRTIRRLEATDRRRFHRQLRDSEPGPREETHRCRAEVRRPSAGRRRV